MLGPGPDGYVAARDAEVKRLRASGARDDATALKSLKKPSVALWAVLAAADEATLVSAAMDATDRLAELQAGGGRRDEIQQATAARRDAIDAVVRAALDALARHDRGGTGPARADEIRGLVDRLSRHPELLDAWLDATVRDIPDDLGFSAFAGVDVAAPPSRPDAGGRGRSIEAESPEEPPRPDPQELAAAEREVEAARGSAGEAARQAVRARDAVAHALAQLDAATAAVEAAERAAADADDRARDANADLAAATEALHALRAG